MRMTHSSADSSIHHSIRDTGYTRTFRIEQELAVLAAIVLVILTIDSFEALADGSWRGKSSRRAVGELRHYSHCSIWIVRSFMPFVSARCLLSQSFREELSTWNLTT